METEEKFVAIKNLCLASSSKDPLELAEEIMRKDFISVNGPEHHMLDGAAFLTAYKNAGGQLDLPSALDELAKRARLMPGAMCGYWGVCGAVASLGASFSIINKISPLSHEKGYKDNMAYTSSVLKSMSGIGGPRCCKRNAFLAITYAVKFAQEQYGIKMDVSKPKCEFASLNKQCLGPSCPFYPRNK
ncbi:MAG: DUF5714 domain-containing protein [Bacilli bacterium]|jgi:hypothetical protein|nr:DUF5714 domain-containing protein [Bacilli bacterium]